MAEKVFSILITGASTGIGQVTARHLAKKGFRVFAGVRRQEDVRSLEERAEGKIFPIMLDVTNDDDISRAFEAVSAQVGSTGLNALMNNAGVVVGGPLEALSREQLHKQLDVNVISQIKVTQAFLPLLRQSKGRIIFTGSISGKIAVPLTGAYSMSKFALEGAADALRRELKPSGVDVILLEPGKIATPLWKKSLEFALELERNYTPEVRALYADIIEQTKKGLARVDENATPAEVVADVVYRVLNRKNPGARYLVGTDAKIGNVLNKLPDRTQDWILSKVFARLL